MDIEGTRLIDATGWVYWLFFESGSIHRPFVAINDLDFKRIIEREGYELIEKKV